MASTTKPANSLKVLWHLAGAKIRGKTHEERLESFYGGQAESYDAFRKRMLHGREELFGELPADDGAVWIDMGAGTGENAEHWGERLGNFKQAYLVDLSESLLTLANRRIEERGWDNVTAVHADATKFVPPEQQVDLITFSYSLTMIPDWFAAIDHACSLLKPGGVIGVVDFYVSRKYPTDGDRKHGWLTRTGWPIWFGMDNVMLNPNHVPYLRHRFEQTLFEERRGKLPFLPLVRVPHYLFRGRLSAGANGVSETSENSALTT